MCQNFADENARGNQGIQAPTLALHLDANTRLPRTDDCRMLAIERFAMSDQDIQKLESQFPAVSGSAFAAARDRVLASGQSVLSSEDGAIYEIFPDGRRLLVKHIEPPTQFQPGSIFTIR